MLTTLLRSTRRLRHGGPLQVTTSVCCGAKHRFPVGPHCVSAVPGGTCVARPVLARCFSVESGSVEDHEDGDRFDHGTSEKQTHARTEAWEKKILLALRTSREIFGDTTVPQAFVVPEGDTRWPRELGGYKLGIAVSQLRGKLKRNELSPSAVSELTQLDFVENVPEYRWNEVVLPSLKVHKEEYGHCIVETGFVVPAASPWPKEAWGYKLGLALRNLRSRLKNNDLPSFRVEQLRKLGFVDDYYAHNWSEVVLPSLEVYKQEHGNCMVEQNFKVPSRPPWPEKAWGYDLGVAVSNLRVRMKSNDFPSDRVKELERLEFVQDAFAHIWNEVVLPSLRVYRQEHGHCVVEIAFKVPAISPWPREAWGFKLGTTVNHLRDQMKRGDLPPDRVDELEELGFVWDVSEYNWNEIVLPSLKVYKQERGHCIVERGFKVPSRAPWPETAWGFSLGNIVSSIRTKSTYTEQRARDGGILEQLGFAHDRNLSTWNEFLFPALEIYRAEFGTCDVPKGFIIPDKEPWPKLVRGMKLGSKIKGVNRGNYFAIIGRDVDRLKKLGFSFRLYKFAWEQRVVPLLDIYKTECASELIPVDFVIPAAAPWPKKVWGVHLGYIVARNGNHLR